MGLPDPWVALDTVRAALPDFLKGAWEALRSAAQFLLGLASGALLLLLGLWLTRRRKYWLSQVTLNLPFGLGNITYLAGDHDRVAAWKLYVQLKTRKAALPLDAENDLIAEVYDSLYELFPITRDLLSGLPVDEAARRDGFADLALRVLNDGLRPHLTTWHGGFRRWWDHALADAENQNKTPQEIQRGYPSYEPLLHELRAMNAELGKYADDLLAIAQSGPAFPGRGRAEGVLKPEAPTPGAGSQGTDIPGTASAQAILAQPRQKDVYGSPQGM